MRLPSVWKSMLLPIAFALGSSSAAHAQTAEPATPATVAPSEPAAAASDEAEQAQLMAALSAAQEMPDTSVPPLRFYGFMDAGVQKSWGGLYKSGLSQSDALTFVVGNINLYMDINPSPQWRGLVEVRFTTFPNGAEVFNPATGQFTSQDTTILDYTSPTGGFLNVQWGSIILERAQVDWEPLDELKVRVGNFLTPYGIWNVDHGTPTRIAVIPPTFMTHRMLPERQIGLDLHGTFHLQPWELGYHLYLTNGRAVAVDYTDDKAIGGRLQLQVRRPIYLQLGVSMFYGKTQTVQKTIGVSMGMLGVVRNTTVDYEELAGGADVSVDAGSLRVRSEFVFNRTVFKPGKRLLFAGVPRANQFSYNAYVQVAYQLPWLGIEPMLWGELIYIPMPGVPEAFAGVSAGFNVYFTPNVIWRCQIGRAVGFNLSGPKAQNADINQGAARLILAF